ncbi:MAG: hypothetical protein Q8K98_02130 [Bacteroidota bacterium]|nr:hypothetical protein [Bacteroidota bacterium]
MKFWLAYLLIVPLLAFSQEDFDSSPNEKKLEWNGNLDVKYSLLQMSQTSPAYRLQFYSSKDISRYLSQYRIEPYLNAEYKSGSVGFFMKTHATYFSDEEATVDLFEAYARYSPTLNTSLQIGKSIYNWGKGYAFNPVGYVNPLKDPENPELAQAGILSANVEYIKSFSSSSLQTFAAQALIIPAINTINNRFGEAKYTDVAAKLYFLFLDTDIDLMIYQGSRNPKRYGFDVSKNIMENLEFHTEFGLTRNADRYFIDDGVLSREHGDVYSYLVGIRYLSIWNTTVIAEYYRNGFGLSKTEYESYYNYLINGLAIGTPVAIQQTLGISQTYFKSNTSMQDYLYVKLTQPEPFDLLYFTPSVYTIYNLQDNSFLLSTNFTYKPETNLEFIIWYTSMFGKEASEFGSRQVEQKVELWMRAYF